MTTLEDEELPPSPESVLSAYDESGSSCSESVNEDDSNDSIIIRDWVVVNLILQKTLVYRYVGQILSESRGGCDIKFAKKWIKCPQFPLKFDSHEAFRRNKNDLYVKLIF